MGKTIRSSKFGAEVKSKTRQDLANAKNRKHLKLGLRASTHDNRDNVRSNPKLRRLQQQLYFCDIVTWSELKARKFLQDHGVVGKKTERLKCWECDKIMQKSARKTTSSGGNALDSQQCTTCRTNGRHRLELNNASLAYSPFWHGMSRGFSPQFALWLRVAFAISVKMPTDTMLQVVQDAKRTLSEKLLDRWVQECNYVMAFTEHFKNKDVKFRNEIFEMDGNKIATQKVTSDSKHLNRLRRSKAAKTKGLFQGKVRVGRFGQRMAARGDKRPMVHHGRMLVLRGRESRNTVMVPMKPCTTQRGAPSPPEDKQSVLKALRRHVDASSCIAATDSGKV